MSQVLRGNTIVTPIGKGLLYVQPLYLDSPGDSLPSLWRVIVGFGDGQVYCGREFPEALSEALGVEVAPEPAHPRHRVVRRAAVPRLRSS